LDRYAPRPPFTCDLACDNSGPQEVVFPPAQMLPDVFECDFKLDGTRLTVPKAPASA
jgi:hypothetical protein